MVISSLVSSVLVLLLGLWAYMRLESSMNLFAERQLQIEPSKFSYKMWREMPVTMYQSFTFFNLTNWHQVKSVGQKPHFVEVGPYVYKTIWSKQDIKFADDDKKVSYAERKQWHYQPQLSNGHPDDHIWTINTPLMTALALIQNAPVITRNIVSVVLDGLGEGAFIRRPIKSLLFDGYSDLIVSVGPLFDRRFANFNGKFAYFYNKNHSVDGLWTVATGTGQLENLNKILSYQNNIVNMTSGSAQPQQGLNEVKAECAAAWSLEQATNGQLFAPFNRDTEQSKLQRQLQQLKAKQQQQHLHQTTTRSQQPQSQPQPQPQQQQHHHSNRLTETIVQAPKRFFSRSPTQHHNSHAHQHHHQPRPQEANNQHEQQLQQRQLQLQEKLHQLRDLTKFIFYPDLCRPIHLLPASSEVTSDNGLQASRYFIDPRMFMNSTQAPANKCFEMNPRPALANTLAATINSVTGANVNVPSIISGASSPFAMFIPPALSKAAASASPLIQQQQQQPAQAADRDLGIFERANHHHHTPTSFINNALHNLGAGQLAPNSDQLASSSNVSPIGRLGRVRQLFTNIVSQRMSAAGPLLPSLTSAPSSLLLGNQHHNHQLQPLFSPANTLARNAPELSPFAHHHHHHHHQNPLSRHSPATLNLANGPAGAKLEPAAESNSVDLPIDHSAALKPANVGADLLLGSADQPAPITAQPPIPLGPAGASSPAASSSASDRWITQFRFKWPRGVFSIGQCQLGAPLYVSMPHFLDADDYYLEQVDGLKPNRSLHEFYIDVESTLHSIPVGAKARLQLNVATPELRFRNIPNAMIPVLWQEVSFEIDKPVVSMLYWSFTMSATMYKLVSLLLIGLGSGLFVWSLVGGVRRQRGLRSQAKVGCDVSSTTSTISSSSPARRQSSCLNYCPLAQCTQRHLFRAHQHHPRQQQQQQHQQRHHDYHQAHLCAGQLEHEPANQMQCQCVGHHSQLAHNHSLDCIGAGTRPQAKESRQHNGGFREKLEGLRSSWKAHMLRTAAVGTGESMGASGSHEGILQSSDCSIDTTTSSASKVVSCFGSLSLEELRFGGMKNGAFEDSAGCLGARAGCGRDCGCAHAAAAAARASDQICQCRRQQQQQQVATCPKLASRPMEEQSEVVACASDSSLIVRPKQQPDGAADGSHLGSCSSIYLPRRTSLGTFRSQQ